MSTKFGRFQSHHPLSAYLILSTTVTLIVVLLLEFRGGWEKLSPILHGNRAQVYNTLVSLYGTLAGFVLTSLVFVAGFLEKPALKNFNRAGHSIGLMRIFHAVLLFLGIATLFAFICLMFDRDSANSVDYPCWRRWFAYSQYKVLFCYHMR
jgi:hypothetical protein